MQDLTVLILAQNEEKNIERSVSSVRKIAKRIIVVDSGSTDRTIELAQKNGAEVIQHAPFINYATQFNWGLNNTGIDTKWVLRLDADEQITEAQALTGLVDSQSQSFYGKTRVAQAKRKADAARKQAKAAQQQQSQHSKASLVDDTMSMSAGDVMNYAGGLTSAIGGGDKSDSSKSAGSGTND